MTTVTDKRFLDRCVKRRIDFKLYHNRGRKVDKSILFKSKDETIQNMADDKVDQLNLRQESIDEDIVDFLDENQIKEISDNVSDIDSAITRVEELRSSYRGIHKELKSKMENDYDPELKDRYEKVLRVIKDYIVKAKEARKDLR